MKKFLNALFKGIEILIAVLLALMIVILFMNVVLRYVFSKGFAWSEEIARLCFIYLVYLGSIGAMRDNRHLLIETVLVRIPPLAQKVLYAVLQAVIIWLMSILTAGSWSLAAQNFNNRWVVTQFPSFLVWGAGVLTGVSIIIIALANLFRLVVLKLSVEELIKIYDDSEEMADAAASREAS